MFDANSFSTEELIRKEIGTDCPTETQEDIYAIAVQLVEECGYSIAEAVLIAKEDIAS